MSDLIERQAGQKYVSIMEKIKRVHAMKNALLCFEFDFSVNPYLGFWYAEEGLYLICDCMVDAYYFVEAGSPHKAIEKVLKRVDEALHAGEPQYVRRYTQENRSMKNTNNDSISRQAALDKLNELKKVELVNAGNKPSKSYWALQAALMVAPGLPSAEPDGTDTSVGGTIYRQAAIDAINSHFGFSIEEEYGSAVQEVINGLPPAQPERLTGNWTGVDDEPCDVYECDRCGTTYDTVDGTWDLPNFCPNCGARMVQEGEDNDS